LENGTSHEMLTGSNVVPLLILSDYYQTRWLFEACQAYIIENLDLDTMIDLLKNVVIPRQFSEMLIDCIYFLSKNIKSMSLEQSQKIKEIANQEGLVDLKLICSSSLLSNFSKDPKELIVTLSENQLDDLQKSLKEIMAISKWHDTRIKLKFQVLKDVSLLSNIITHES